MIDLKFFLENYTAYKDFAEIKKFGEVEFKDKKYPLVSLHFGNENNPCLLVVGGIHGLEQIGAQLCLSLLNSFHERLHWDKTLSILLEKIQVVFIPLTNPVGYFQLKRSNGNRVDLMRNAPLEATESVPFLLGGHRQNRTPKQKLLNSW